MKDKKIEWLVWVVAERMKYGFVWASVHGCKVDAEEEMAKMEPGIERVVLQADLIAEKPLSVRLFSER